MSMWRKTLVYLGLVEEPEEYDELPQRMPPRSDDAVDAAGDEDAAPAVRRIDRVDRADDGSHVRPTAPGLGARVQVVAVTDFDQGAAEIGRSYRTGAPVLFDMTDVDAAVARRVLDFVSGVTFALHGRLTKLGPRAFLIVPEGVELPAEERDRLAALGYSGLPV